MKTPFIHRGPSRLPPPFRPSHTIAPSELLGRSLRAPAKQRRPDGAGTGVDARALAEFLRSRLDGEVRFDDGSRALYATDGSNYRQVPIGVVCPRNVEDVVVTVDACRRFGAPVLSRGGGTSLAGQCCNVAVVIDWTKYCHRLLELSAGEATARVEPGLVLDDLRRHANRHDLTFAPDPSTHSHCALGGMIGNNSCGVHSQMAGRTSDNVIELEVLTWDGLRLRVGRTSDEEVAAIIAAGGRRGEIYRGLVALRDRYADLIRARYPRIPRRVSGYNLDELLPENGFNVARALVGTEGTCVTVLEARLRLVPWPRARSLLVLGFEDVYEAGDHVPEVNGFAPIGLEGLDDRLVSDMKKKGLHIGDLRVLPAGAGWLLCEFGGATREEADAQARRLMAAMRGRHGVHAKLFDDENEERMVWQVRESGLGATARIPGAPDTWEGWEDSAVPPERVGAYLRDLRKLLDEHGYACALYGHFGQGCIHTRIDFGLKDAAGIAKYRRFVERAADVVVAYGGSLSGEHGDGQSRAELLSKMFGRELVHAFAEFKRIWDPENRMNPHKVVDPYRLDENLRYGADYDPPQPATHFRFPDDRGSFSYATERCVGIGNCRRELGGTMCPSYRVTREEMHSTRGRAHLLFEMLMGAPLSEGWSSEAVKESLDLCLACKGCKGECPVNVDMATYKAEFLSHYYEGRRRPRAAWAMGNIDRWARLISLAPGLSNWISHAPGLSAVVKRLGGIAAEREVPRFAGRTFRSWHARHVRPNAGGPRVLLWPDTFNNYLRPETAIAATEVLESAGFDVVIPTLRLCCGRPLYDFGMLDQAASYLRRILTALGPEIEAGTPLIGLEPSCLAVFRDELRGLFPTDEQAVRLSAQSYTLGEFLVKRDVTLPVATGWKAIVQAHCHHKAVLDFGADEEVLRRLGVEAETLDAGCCGMAGSFGFEADKYDVSMQIGERALLPAVRATAEETLVVADGFSCREQIEQTTPRGALHLAEVIRLVQRAQGSSSPPGRLPERAIARDRPRAPSPWTLFAIGVLSGTALFAWRRRHRERR